MVLPENGKRKKINSKIYIRGWSRTALQMIPDKTEMIPKLEIISDPRTENDSRQNKPGTGFDEKLDRSIYRS